MSWRAQAQRVAMSHGCRLGCETAGARFGRMVDGRRASVVLTVNTGYE